MTSPVVTAHNDVTGPFRVTARQRGHCRAAGHLPIVTAPFWETVTDVGAEISGGVNSPAGTRTPACSIFDPVSCRHRAVACRIKLKSRRRDERTRWSALVTTRATDVYYFFLARIAPLVALSARPTGM